LSFGSHTCKPPELLNAGCPLIQSRVVKLLKTVSCFLKGQCPSKIKLFGGNVNEGKTYQLIPLIIPLSIAI
jgi:hypothetical protein